MADNRSFWKGHLRLALVTIPIRLVSATAAAERVALHQVDRETKERIRYQKVAGEGGPAVPRERIVQGVELDDGSYVLVSDEELDALKLKTRHTLELTEFVPAGSIDPIYFDNAYFVLPDGEVAEEGYRVVRDALAGERMMGIGQLTLRGREHLVALEPSGKGLALTTLRYANEVRDAGAVFAGIGSGALRAGLVDMAKKLIEERAGEFDPRQYRNHYAEALKALIEEKRKGGEVTKVTGGDDRPSAPVIDFMEALRRSTSGAGKPRRAAAAEAPREAVRKGEPKGSKAGSSKSGSSPRGPAKARRGRKS
jgi:DNA end-binding protein Ku